MISKDCDGCELLQPCKVRFQKVQIFEKVSCPDGTQHLVDET